MFLRDKIMIITHKFRIINNLGSSYLFWWPETLITSWTWDYIENRQTYFMSSEYAVGCLCHDLSIPIWDLIHNSCGGDLHLPHDREYWRYDVEQSLFGSVCMLEFFWGVPVRLKWIIDTLSINSTPMCDSSIFSYRWFPCC